MVEATTPPNPAGQARQSIPDPTLLTIDALRREIAMLENLVATRLDSAAELEEERFLRVDALMEKAEEQRREQKQDTKAAVDAAQGNFATSLQAIQSTVTDLKDRMTILEAIKQGQLSERTESRLSTAGVWAAVGVIVALFVAAFSVFAFVAGGGV